MSDPVTRPAHTALPWDHSHGEFDEPCVFDSHERVIAGCDNPQFSPEECKANAALIVRAVNSHQALVDALAAMVERWEPDCGGQDRIMWEKAVSALALAEEQP